MHYFLTMEHNISKVDVFWITLLKHISKTINVIHTASSRNEIFREIAIIYKNSWSQFTLQEMISRNSQRKRPQFHEKNRKIPWKQWYWFLRFVLFSRKKRIRAQTNLGFSQFHGKIKKKHCILIKIRRFLKKSSKQVDL